MLRRRDPDRLRYASLFSPSFLSFVVYCAKYFVLEQRYLHIYRQDRTKYVGERISWNDSKKVGVFSGIECETSDTKRKVTDGGT